MAPAPMHSALTPSPAVNRTLRIKPRKAGYLERWASNMFATLRCLIFLLPTALWAAPPEQLVGVGGVTLGVLRAELLHTIPNLRCTPPIQTVESCEVGTEILDDQPLRNTKGTLGFILDKGIVEVIVVKVPASFHAKVIADLYARLGEPKKIPERSAADGKVNLVWRIGSHRVGASNKPGKAGFGGYVISR